MSHLPLKKTLELLGAEEVTECTPIEALHLFLSRHNCRHDFLPINFLAGDNDQIICKKCEQIKTCVHDEGDRRRENGSCYYCVLCGCLTRYED